jgi:SAM-dependent methyltransferase
MPITAQYLTGEYQEKNPSFHVEDSPWKARQIQKMLDAQGISPHRVAEVGCGAGEILAQLARLYPDAKFDGFEISPQGFALCRQRESDRTKFFNSDFCASDAPPYDIVLCIDVFEHVENCFGFLRDLHSRGNAFIFHIPLDMNAQMVLRSAPILMVRSTVGHLHYFSKDTAFAILEECGYDVHSWFYTPNGVERPKSWKARILQFPRRILSLFHKDLTVRLLGGYSLLVYALPRNKRAS